MPFILFFSIITIIEIINYVVDKKSPTLFSWWLIYICILHVFWRILSVFPQCLYIFSPHHHSYLLHWFFFLLLLSSLSLIILLSPLSVSLFHPYSSFCPASLLFCFFFHPNTCSVCSVLACMSIGCMPYFHSPSHHYRSGEATGWHQS